MPPHPGNKAQSLYKMETVSVNFASVTSNPQISMPSSTNVWFLFILPEGDSLTVGQFYVSVCLGLLHVFSNSGTQGQGAALVRQRQHGRSPVSTWRRRGIYKRQSQTTWVSLKLLPTQGAPHLPQAKENHMTTPQVKGVRKDTPSTGKHIKEGNKVVNKSQNEPRFEVKYFCFESQFFHLLFECAQASP